MDNPILDYAQSHLGIKQPNPTLLLTLFSLWDLNRYTLETWNEALSEVLGRRVYCPSYRELGGYLQNAAVGRP